MTVADTRLRHSQLLCDVMVAASPTPWLEHIQDDHTSEGREWGVGSVVVGSAYGAPQIFAPNRSETLQNKGFGAPGLKIGAPQKRRSNDHGSNAPFSDLNHTWYIPHFLGPSPELLSLQLMRMDFEGLS